MSPAISTAAFTARSTIPSSSPSACWSSASSPDIDGDQLLGFGDGYVEIEEVKQAGGVAVGVATDEPECRFIDEWKQSRLIGVGADYIIPNYLCREELLPSLFP